MTYKNNFKNIKNTNDFLDLRSEIHNLNFVENFRENLI